jgi:hypothetical protein
LANLWSCRYILHPPHPEEPDQDSDSEHGHHPARCTDPSLCRADSPPPPLLDVAVAPLLPVLAVEGLPIDPVAVLVACWFSCSPSGMFALLNPMSHMGSAAFAQARRRPGPPSAQGLLRSVHPVCATLVAKVSSNFIYSPRIGNKSPSFDFLVTVGIKNLLFEPLAKMAPMLV